MNKFSSLARQLEESLPNQQVSEESFLELDNSYETLKDIPDVYGEYCQVPQIKHMFSWKRHFSYLTTGTPNTGKTTFGLFLKLLMSIFLGWKWCIWTQEMEDAYKVKSQTKYHTKDIVNTLAWMMIGKTPYEQFAKKHNSPLMTKNEMMHAYDFINKHFKFIHLVDRTPAGIIKGFTKMYEKYGIDGFEVDPWKSVKQLMDSRSDLWMEDVLMTFKEFTLESNSVMNFVVHPKSLKDYKDSDGEYRIITPYDLNGGAAWNNSMDVIVSLRRVMNGEVQSTQMEMYTQKIRKQHLVGVRDQFLDVHFDIKMFRYYFGSNRYCPIEKRDLYPISSQFPTNGIPKEFDNDKAPY